MKMVDVGDKQKTQRVAVATGRVRMSAAALKKIRAGKVEKGDVIGAARIAGIMASKRTPDLIPLCHPISLSGVEVEVRTRPGGVEIRATVKTVDRTGVEMEALTAVSAAALTVYDMLKSTDRGMVIEGIELQHKSGGRSGVWNR
ncbi:MAG: cyclic pyranopterin monophosphate synthase MoaC [Archangium sp.]|nr:cyclic pyranopterin monophosphate synthase MoaC [Archangium sp.]